ncbi:MAG: hypothetical protein ACF8NJ_10925, partial [Phycisphaerales bacterium JB038]
MKKWPAILIANAIIWGLVIVGSAMRLRDTDAFAEIQGILGAGAIGALFLLMVGEGVRVAQTHGAADDDQSPDDGVGNEDR